MVTDVRANVAASVSGCAVCYMIAGEEGTTHISGKNCPKIPLSEYDKEWQEFKNVKMKLRSGLYCFSCFLPTGEKTGMAGADYHRSPECNLPHVIRPFLYALHHHGPPELKTYLKENIGDSSWANSENAYLEWLRKPPGNETPNHIKLYWWTLKFWGRLP